ncbi:hypothetical protein BDZ45DRAFT_608045, partial [Acephala macrosclerotiorum]
LTIESRSSFKQKKNKITFAFTINVNGSKKFDPWIINKTKNFYCFKKINRHFLKVYYRYNKTK